MLEKSVVLFFLFVTGYTWSFVNILSVSWIYAYCDVLCAHYLPQESVPRSSVAQTIDGNLRVRAPGFQFSTSPLLGATLRAQYIF